MMQQEQESIPKRIKVVNRYKHEATINDVYIGRGSLFGNPYSHLPSKYEGIILCENREEAIELYRDHFNSIITGCGCKNKDFKHKLREIIVNLKLGQKVNLVCYCKPKECHGDIIRDYILTQI